MDLIRTTLAAVAMTVAAAASAQTLKMEPQVVGVTTYEASTAVNLVVVKPEIKLEDVRAVLAEKSRAGHTADVRALLQKYGAEKLSAVDPANYEALMKDAEVIGNGS